MSAFDKLFVGLAVIFRPKVDIFVRGTPFEFQVSRPAPGRDYSCCSGIPGFEIGRGQGRGKLY